VEPPRIARDAKVVQEPVGGDGLLTLFVKCEANERIAGGGFSLTNPEQRDIVKTATPTSMDGYWGYLIELYVVPYGGDHGVQGTALCVPQ
jgi:hypothetical protein